MDLSALSNLAKARQQSDHLDQRHDKALQLYRLGCEYLKRAKLSHYQDKSLTKKAIACLVKAIENNRKDARAYIQLARLFLIFKQPIQANKYLQEAVRIDPLDPNAQKLLTYTQKSASRTRMRPVSEPLPIDTQQTELVDPSLQPQVAYAALAQRIQEQIEIAFERVQGLKPSMIPIQVNHMRQTLRQLEKPFDSICQEMDRIEKQIDLSPLEFEFKKLELNLNVFEDILSFSERQIQFRNETLALSQEIEVQMQSSTQEIEPRETYERFLDQALIQCDALADQLEALEGAGNEVGHLMKDYDQLNNVFQSFDNCLNPN